MIYKKCLSFKMPIDKFGRVKEKFHAINRGGISGGVATVIDVKTIVNNELKNVALINDASVIDKIVAKNLANISLNYNKAEIELIVEENIKKKNIPTFIATKSDIELIVDSKIANISAPIVPSTSDIELIVDKKISNISKSLNTKDVETIVESKIQQIPKTIHLNKSDVQLIVQNEMSQLLPKIPQQTEIELLVDSKINLIPNAMSRSEIDLLIKQQINAIPPSINQIFVEKSIKDAIDKKFPPSKTITDRSAIEAMVDGKLRKMSLPSIPTKSDIQLIVYNEIHNLVAKIPNILDLEIMMDSKINALSNKILSKNDVNLLIDHKLKNMPLPLNKFAIELLVENKLNARFPQFSTITNKSDIEALIQNQINQIPKLDLLKKSEVEVLIENKIDQVKLTLAKTTDIQSILNKINNFPISLSKNEIELLIKTNVNGVINSLPLPISKSEIEVLINQKIGKIPRTLNKSAIELIIENKLENKLPSNTTLTKKSDIEALIEEKIIKQPPSITKADVQLMIENAMAKILLKIPESSDIESTINNKINNIPSAISKSEIELMIIHNLQNIPKPLDKLSTELLIDSLLNSKSFISKFDAETLIENKVKNIQIPNVLKKSDIELLFDEKFSNDILPLIPDRSDIDLTIEKQISTAILKLPTSLDQSKIETIVEKKIQQSISAMSSKNPVNPIKPPVISINKSEIETIIIEKLKQLPDQNKIEELFDDRFKKNKMLLQTDVDVILNKKLNAINTSLLTKTNVEKIIEEKNKKLDFMKRQEIEALVDSMLKSKTFSHKFEDKVRKDFLSLTSKLNENSESIQRLIPDISKYNLKLNDVAKKYPQEFHRFENETKTKFEASTKYVDGIVKKWQNLFDVTVKNVNDLKKNVESIEHIQKGVSLAKQPKLTQYYSTDFIILPGETSTSLYHKDPTIWHYEVQLFTGHTNFIVPEQMIIKAITFLYPTNLTVWVDGIRYVNPKTLVGKTLKAGQQILLTHTSKDFNKKTLVTLLVNVPITTI